MIVQDGQFIVDNISFYEDAKIGTELTAEADWKRRGLYIGPQFDTLDVAVQDEFENFLRERGVNEAVAQFIPQFAEFKEQKVGDTSSPAIQACIDSLYTGICQVVAAG